MSIKRVQCPQCNVPINVPASMASTQCPSCGGVFSISAAASQASNPQPARPAKTVTNDDDDSDSGDRIGQWLVVGGVAGLAVVGLILLVLFSGGSTEEPEKPEVPMRSQAQVVEDLKLEQTPGEVEYREVDLPESTRQKIYRDYSQMIASSFGKAKKIPKSGVAGQALNQTLGAVVDREVTHIALTHGITEEDVAQIYAEGQAKGWK
ncbi:hypothetical protein Mal15_34660 [Stieleria maiorica]|uniref:Uncharacterized protein n=1 Tax=Stieleria maiorica TaxID=2795974 RepID=A0A5B9MDR9_9BACT|nr:hypothetical protein [Stieleria maiorica]QEF99402.1 hypothetical protein Mal15_34660 [Stieleria maiorica]